jgi:hypothetical protein
MIGDSSNESGAAMRTLRGLWGVGVVTGMSLLLALVGCGSSSKTTSTTAASPVAATPTTAGGSVKPATYNINLAHVAGSSGAADAAGVVVLSVKSSSGELCWSISPVKSFPVSTSTTTPTIVTIQPTANGTPSTPGIPLGPAYKSSACIHAPSVFLGRLEAHPQTFYLSIYNTATGDAVRGQI